MADPRSKSLPAAVPYSIIREDERLEGDLVIRTRASKVLTVASGGCVALSLKARFPHLQVSVFDKNAAQLAHVLEKAEAAERRDLKRLNIEYAGRRGLNQCGELERVFRLLRLFFEEFIAPHEELLRFFTRGAPLHELDKMVLRWTTSKYFRAAFHTAFTPVLLATTLGDTLPMWAKDGTHPLYFQKAFEKGLRRDAAPENPFLQHVFLGGYRANCAPTYARLGGRLALRNVHHGDLLAVDELGSYDVVSLSNLMDACSEEEARSWASALTALRPGAAILLRQFNSKRSLRPYFEPAFEFDTLLGRSYFLRDRSLIYNRVEVGFRTDKALG